MRCNDWQQGSEIWQDPVTAQGRPSKEDALANATLRAQRALLDWFASDTEYTLPCSCQSCGQATRNICRHCLKGVCEECDNNTPNNLPVPCCMEMAGSDESRVSVPPFRANSTDFEWITELMVSLPSFRLRRCIRSRHPCV